MEKDMNQSTLIYKGDIINNISVNGFIIIKKGFIDLVGKIEAEYIEDLLNKKREQLVDDRFSKGSILRLLEVQIVGFIENDTFNSGIKHLPMIGNLAFIPTKKQIENVYLNNGRGNPEDHTNLQFSIGKSLSENIDITFSINGFFASHIGIFGNTGSGKSNTLAKVYNELFNIDSFKFKNKSSFHLIDFNGEYSHEGVFGLKNSDLNIIKLDTKADTGNKINILSSDFYNSEILSILFSAKEQTQKPFIKRLLKSNKRAAEKGWGFKNWLPFLYSKSLVHSSKEVFEYIKEIIEYISVNEMRSGHEDFLNTMRELQWHSNQGKFFIGNYYFDTSEQIHTVYRDVSGYSYLYEWCSELDDKEIGWCEKFIINAKLYLVYDMLNKYAQFDHINPLIHRIESKMQELEKILTIVDDISIEHSVMNIYSFRECSTDI
ncbi:ATP-binding protein [Paraliobacillus zengyii]|uniref:ATP-binding protein n=1 Tax=Paraliobacillus zengyii TaxID=2213194 RepID=UPI0013A70A3D|nr:DUF87 domain-containing protein [Paraliobacillus zengyii]